MLRITLISKFGLLFTNSKKAQSDESFGKKYTAAKFPNRLSTCPELFQCFALQPCLAFHPQKHCSRNEVKQQCKTNFCLTIIYKQEHSHPSLVSHGLVSFPLGGKEFGLIMTFRPILSQCHFSCVLIRKRLYHL